MPQNFDLQISPHGRRQMIYQGVLLGLTLSFMVGPLLFAIVEAGLERGFRSGLAVAAGIWASDVLYVAAVWHSLEMMSAVVALPSFKWWAGLTGGALLMAFGLGSLLSRPKLEEGQISPRQRLRSWGTYFLRGFLINTVNPFTVFFWIGIAGGVVAPSNWSQADMLRFFGAMLLTLAIADTIKAYAAKQVRQWLTHQHVGWAKRGIGVLLLVFGVVLVLRVW